MYIQYMKGQMHSALLPILSITINKIFFGLASLEWFDRRIREKAAVRREIERHRFNIFFHPQQRVTRNEQLPLNRSATL